MAETKAPPALAFTPKNCWRAHRLWVGAQCPTCATEIPAGPFTPEDAKRYFSDGSGGFWIGNRRVNDTDPALVANPPTTDEVDADVELKEAREAFPIVQAAYFNLELERDRALAVSRGNYIMVFGKRLTLDPTSRAEPDPTKLAQLKLECDKKVKAAFDAMEDARARLEDALVRVNALGMARGVRIEEWRRGQEPPPAPRRADPPLLDHGFNEAV